MTTPIVKRQAKHHMTPIVTNAPNLTRFANTILELSTAAAKCEEAIEALGRAQLCLKPGPLERFLVLLECDMAVCLDNQRALVAQLKDLIDARIDEAATQPAPIVGGDPL